MADSKYILGDADEELIRLQVQHEVWSNETKRLLTRAGFSSGQRVLDIGCGPGFSTFDLLEIVGEKGQVIAIDSSRKMIDVMNREMARRGISNVAGILQDVECIDDQLGEVDGAFARWVLCFLENPESVIQGVSGILESGGKLAVMDYFNYHSITVQPASLLFERVFQAVFESFQSAGGGLEVGRRVPEFMESAGLRVESIEPICGVGRPGTGIWNWLTDFQHTYLPKLVEKGFLTSLELDEYDEFWTEISQRPDAFFFAPPMLGIVGTKT